MPQGKAATLWDQVEEAGLVIEELAERARSHNDANILCIPARHISLELAKKIVDIFFNTDFEGGRHANRVGKIAC